MKIKVNDVVEIIEPPFDAWGPALVTKVNTAWEDLFYVVFPLYPGIVCAIPGRWIGIVAPRL